MISLAADTPGLACARSDWYWALQLQVLTCAGLWGAVSLAKGCYMGQETLAKVFNLKATRRRLAGLALPGPAQPGTPVMLGTALLMQAWLYSLQRGQDAAAIHVSSPCCTSRGCFGP